MELIITNPRGFCAGVDRAIEIVDRAITMFGAPIYVRHEVVHNRFVVERLREKGAVFVEELEEVPNGATVIFSAHGVSQAVRQQAKTRKLQVFDATCPLVTKVHMEVVRNCKKGLEVILIGHAGHPEVEGTMGQINSGMFLVESVADVKKLDVKNPDALTFVTQTTLSVDDTKEIINALSQRFPKIRGPRKDDICYATQNRQDAVKQIAKDCDVLLVVGSVNSSNSNRLREVAEAVGTQSYMVDGADDLQKNWFKKGDRIGLTAGASAPEVLVQQVVDKLKQWGVKKTEEQAGQLEQIVFTLPKTLRAK